MIDEKTIEKMFEEWINTQKYEEWDKFSSMSISKFGFTTAINLLLPIIQKQDEQLKWCKSNVGYASPWWIRIDKTQKEVSEMIKRLGGEA